MSFQDLQVECIDCHQPFVFTAGEQQFYDRKGFKETPKRCKTCRETRKTKRDAGGGEAGSGAAARGGYRGGYGGGGYSGGGSAGYGGGGGYGGDDDFGNRAPSPSDGGGGYSTGGAPRGGGGGAGGGAARPAREMFDAVCFSCGTQTRVPFKPASGRPVYCRDCYANRNGGGH